MCLNVSYTKVSLRKGGWKVIAHPCGHCVECSKKYQNDWMLRLDDEATQWKTIMFATFTYSNENIPFLQIGGEQLDKYRFFFMKRIAQLPYKDRSRYVNDTTGFYDYLFADRIAESTSLLVPYADITDIQKFFKRMRINFKRHEGRDFKCKYFLCSEYGNATLRPHYHMILFCNEHEYLVQQYIQNNYHLGKVHDIHKIKSFKDRGVLDAMRYVSKYTCKPAEFENPYVVSGLIPKPRRVPSKFLGDHKRQEIKKAAYDYQMENDANGYTDEFLEGYLHTADIMKNGFKYSTPKYWRDVLFPTITVQEKRIKDGKEIIKKRTIKDIDDHLSVAIEDYVQRRIMEVQRTEYAQIKYQHPEMSDTEIIHAYTLSTMEKAKDRYAKAIQSFYRYYSRSAGKSEAEELPINDGRIVNETERDMLSLFSDTYVYGDTELEHEFGFKHLRSIDADFGDYYECMDRFTNEHAENRKYALKELINKIKQNKN